MLYGFINKISLPNIHNRVSKTAITNSQALRSNMGLFANIKQY